MTKPFLPEELLARVRAVLRRPKKVNVENKAKYKNITIDNLDYFGREGLYGYWDDGARFAFIQMAVLTSAK